MNSINLIQEYAKIVYQLLAIAFIFWRWSDVKTIFCEGGSGNMSSKRVIAIMGMATLCRLALYTTHETGGVDNNILAVLTVVVLTASAIATFPQILSGISTIKGIATKETKEEVTKVEVKSDVPVDVQP